MAMCMTSNKPMSRLNWTRALHRIIKEMDHILGRSGERTLTQRAHLDAARQHILMAAAIQKEETKPSKEYKRYVKNFPLDDPRD